MLKLNRQIEKGRGTSGSAPTQSATGNSVPRAQTARLPGILDGERRLLRNLLEKSRSIEIIEKSRIRKILRIRCLRRRNFFA